MAIISKNQKPQHDIHRDLRLLSSYSLGRIEHSFLKIAGVSSALLGVNSTLSF